MDHSSRSNKTVKPSAEVKEIDEAVNINQECQPLRKKIAYGTAIYSEGNSTSGKLQNEQPLGIVKIEILPFQTQSRSSLVNLCKLLLCECCF